MSALPQPLNEREQDLLAIIDAKDREIALLREAATTKQLNSKSARIKILAKDHADELQAWFYGFLEIYAEACPNWAFDPMARDAMVRNVIDNIRKLRQPAEFARDVLGWILNESFFFSWEESETICAMLQKHGFVERALYDPEKHGDIDGAEPGSDVWVWTDRMRAEARR